MDNIKTQYYHIWRENNVLIAVISGQWSSVQTKAYAKDFRSIAYLLSHEPWAHITYLDDWQLATPDSAVHISELEQWCMSNNLSCDAVVYKEHAIKDYLLANALQKTSNNPKVYRHFTSSKEAIRWIRSKGFKPSSEKIAV